MVGLEVLMAAVADVDVNGETGAVLSVRVERERIERETRGIFGGDVKHEISIGMDGDGTR